MRRPTVKKEVIVSLGLLRRALFALHCRRLYVLAYTLRLGYAIQGLLLVCCVH